MEAIDTTSAGGTLIFHVFGALAQFERDLIRERTLAGLDEARSHGRVGGRPTALDERGIAVAGALLQDPSIPIREVACHVGVSKATLYKYFPGGRRPEVDMKSFGFAAYLASVLTGMGTGMAVSSFRDGAESKSAAGGVPAAREALSFYRDGRVIANKARRAARLAGRLTVAVPSRLEREGDRGLVFSLDWVASIEAGVPVYDHMTNVGRR